MHITARRSTDAVRRLRWAHGELEVQALGGMLAPVVFRAAGHADFAPLQVAPWADEPGAEQWDGLLRRLRGEWPCLPFGRCDLPAGMPAGWSAVTPGDGWAHGYASHHVWQWQDTEPDPCDALALRIDYPADAEISHLQRHVRPDPARPAVDITLEVHARRAVSLPTALHPTFSLGLGRVQLQLPGHAGGHSYPVPCEAGVSRLQPDTAFAQLRSVPTVDGAALDLSRFPLPHDTEELLQLRGLERGAVHLDYLDAGWRATLEWPTQALPDLMLWVSHRGRRQPPWNGRHLALGVEPVNGCFDLGRVARPPAGHGLADRAGLALAPGQAFTLHYCLSAQALAPAAGHD
ncbi:MAG: hypothetical protein RIQ60_3466 [Pseudomonadota bacterium]